MSLILLRIWPAFIPLILYLIWLFYRKKKARAEGAEVTVEVFKGPLFWCLTASFVLLLLSFLIYGLAQGQHPQGRYIPPHYEGGKLSPARVDKE